MTLPERIHEQEVDALFESSDAVLHALFMRMLSEPEPGAEQAA